jgi:hypothetical protein
MEVKVALTLYDPGDKVVVQLAVLGPPVGVASVTAAQSVVPPAVNVTVPEGVTLVACRDATVAVKAADVPYVTVLPELETSVVVVGSLLTVWVSAADVEPAKLLALGV